MAVALRQSWFPAAEELKAMTREGLTSMKGEMAQLEETVLARLAGALLGLEHRRRHPLEFLLHHLPGPRS